MKTEIENFQSGFPECLESVKITMGQQNVDCNQFSSWTSRWGRVSRTVHVPGIIAVVCLHTTTYMYVHVPGTVITLISENAPNLRTVILGEFPNLVQREPSCLSNPNLPVVIQYNGED